MNKNKSFLFDTWCSHPCFLILILPSTLTQLAAHCRQRPSQTSMTFTMTFVCKEALRISIGRSDARWIVGICWHGLFGSMSCVNLGEVQCELRRYGMAWWFARDILGLEEWLLGQTSLAWRAQGGEGCIGTQSCGNIKSLRRVPMQNIVKHCDRDGMYSNKWHHLITIKW